MFQIHALNRFAIGITNPVRLLNDPITIRIRVYVRIYARIFHTSGFTLLIPILGIDRSDNLQYGHCTALLHRLRLKNSILLGFGSIIFTDEM